MKNKREVPSTSPKGRFFSPLYEIWKVIIEANDGNDEAHGATMT